MQLKLAKKIVPLTTGKLPFVFGLANTERRLNQPGRPGKRQAL
jgi:hypothetical protein